ncbi:phosphatidylinositol 4-kinase gamma 5-like [Rutidosis leptorrhynchoides]|uniref:phosphatidylinositol 4-kinase gamma 5-like n=1 Tax=Rutidosis leptorrhynchoides TaxID=125765 RepID=UPI003A994E5B
MSANRDSPVQTQMAVSIFRSPLGAEYHGKSRIEGAKATGRRRVFVQTETGCVLGMEIDRSDNAHMVKRRLQIALNVPFEESSLSFGDMVLNNDLSAVRNDSPLLFTRNALHRSSSTPCLSPFGKDLQQKDQSGPVEILGHAGSFVRTKQIVDEVVNAIKNGVDPVPVHGGLGGAYYFKNIKGESVAIVKPTDEEPFAPNNPKGFVGKALGQPGLKRSVRVGETGFREVAAFLLDYDHFANVPPTALVKITHSIFNVNDDVSKNINNNNTNINKKIQRKKKLYSKIASLQQFIAHDFDASDHGTSSFPVSVVHRIGILDVRIFNTDRHAGNLLVRKMNNDEVGRFSEVELIPIDHGLCLPENLEDPYFEWIHWPQSSIPFSEDELEYIEKLDPYGDSDMLKTELPMIREACLRVLVLCTVFLKEAASYGLCLAEIGEMMSREFRCGEEEPSELEVLCMDARKVVAEKETEMAVLSPKCDDFEDGFQFDIDCDESAFDLTPKLSNDSFVNTSLPYQFGYGRNPLTKLEETIEEEEEEEGSDEETNEVVPYASTVVPSVSKLSISLTNSCSLGDKGKKTKVESNGGFVGVTSSSGHKSANEMLPAGTNFVKFDDMNEEEWSAFLDIFQDLLHDAFAKRKSIVMGQKPRQRLGTSCQF